MRDYFKLKTWLITALMFIIALVLSSAIVFYEFGLKKNIKITSADAGDNVTGWAWNANTGWINFNCTGDTPACGASDYGVDINLATGNFSGYAWSSSVGWISFQENNAPDGYIFNSACPNVCNNSNNCTACYNSANGKVYGWARILSFKTSPADSNNGWIKLRDDPDYGVSIAANGDFSGWAWNANDNGSGIGWVSFNCAGEIPACNGTNYKVALNEVNTAPWVTNLTAPNVQACQSDALNVYLRWVFNDSNTSPSESAYQIIVNTEDNTDTPFFDSGKCTAATFGGKCTAVPGAGQFPLQLALSNISQSLNYDTPYYWWVKVWDEHDLESGVNPTQYNSAVDTPAEADDGAPLTFTTYKHNFPQPDAVWFPLKPSKGEKVKFTDQSKRFFSGNPTTPVDCAIDTCDWQWTLPMGASFDNSIPNNNSATSTPTIIFNSAGPTTVTLKVLDQVNVDTGNSPYSCVIDLNVNVSAQLPGWKEVKPE